MTDDQRQPNGGDREQKAVVEAVRAEHKQRMATLDAQLTEGMPLGLRVFFDERLFTRMQAAAEMMAAAEGFVPRHLVRKPEACFAVLSKALGWSLDPYAVAGSTYQTPDGKIGYEGKLVQAIVENSGRFRWAEPDRDHDGNVIAGTRPIEYLPNEAGWFLKVQGKFKMEPATSKSGKQYDAPVATWTAADEEGLGIKYRFHVDNGPMREWTFWLKQAVIRNSTLWPTDPMTQCHYAGIRRLASVACPSLIMGVPFRGDEEIERESEMRDITPEAPAPVNLEEKKIVAGNGAAGQDNGSREATPEEPAHAKYVWRAQGFGRLGSNIKAEIEKAIAADPENARDQMNHALAEHPDIAAAFRQGRAQAIVDEINAAAPSDVELLVEHHEESIAALPEKLRHEVLAAARERAAQAEETKAMAAPVTEQPTPSSAQQGGPPAGHPAAKFDF